MKLLFISDLQLGSGAAYGTPQRSRLEDQAETLEAVTALVDQEGVETVVIAGDVFQHRRPGIDELVVFNRWLSDLPAEIIILAGNHDSRGPGLPATIDLFRRQSEATLTRPYVLELRSMLEHPDVALAVLPWAHPGPLKAAREGATGPEQAAAMLEIAAGLYAEAEEKYPDAVRVLVTHYALTGFSTPTGLSTGELVGETVLDSHALAAQGWGFVFAGHIHAPAKVRSGVCELVSIGSPWIQDFGETETEHGCWLFNSAAPASLFVPLPGRRFVTLAGEDLVDLTALGDGGTTLVPNADVRDAVVRVKLEMTEEGAAGLDVAALKKALEQAGAHKVFAVHLDVERSARARREGITEDVEPLAALDAWASSIGLDDPATERLHELTESLLAEVAS